MMKSTYSPIYFIGFLLLLSLACQTVTGAFEESTTPDSATIVAPESVTVAAATEEVTLPPIDDPAATVEAVATVPVSLDEAIQVFDDVSAAHEENPEYPDTGAPPPGGPHAPAWQNCGIYTEPVEAKNVLHSLEHGAIWLAYRPDLPAEDVVLLWEVVKNQPYVVMSPYPGLRSAVVLTAWGLQFETDVVVDPRIVEFVFTYQQGPQTPEPGAPCQGGVGFPKAPGSLDPGDLSVG
jgi:hypothetical protein